MFDRSEVGRRGYLEEEFRLFHLRDQTQLQLDYHCHTFDKVIVLLSGRVTYLVEGSTYYLRPWDILLVSRGEIHRPVIDVSEPYERMVLWLRPRLDTPDTQPLLDCFALARERGTRLIRPVPAERPRYRALLNGLEEAQTSTAFGHQVLARTYFLQLLVALNRQLPGSPSAYPGSTRQDPKLEEVLRYINGHLDGDLSAEALSRAVYLSRAHLMRKFKADTGQTLHQYILQKRLIRASELIQEGLPAVQASQAVGFGSYTTFVRTFRNLFHALPSDMKPSKNPEDLK